MFSFLRVDVQRVIHIYNLPPMLSLLRVDVQRVINVYSVHIHKHTSISNQLRSSRQGGHGDTRTIVGR
jgi:hypothetical protein